MSAKEGSGIIYCISYLGVEFSLYSFSCEFVDGRSVLMVLFWLVGSYPLFLLAGAQYSTLACSKMVIMIYGMGSDHITIFLTIWDHITIFLNGITITISSNGIWQSR